MQWMQWSTGNRAVDAVGMMDFSGNVTPRTWYQTIRLESGKPDLVAITMLSEIVYWYRPVEQASAEGGTVRRYCKFKADKLQLGYKHFEEHFGLTRDQCKQAFVRLESLGVVKREQREILAAGQTVSAMFVGLDADALRELTYPTKQGNLPGRVENSVENSEQDVENSGSVENPVEKSVENYPETAQDALGCDEGGVYLPPPQGRDTPPYTKSTQKITQKTLSPVQYMAPSGEGVRRGVSSRATPPAPAQAVEAPEDRTARIDGRDVVIHAYPDEVPCACGCTAHKAQRLPSCRTYVCDSCGAVWQEPAFSAPQSPKIRAFGDGWE